MDAYTLSYTVTPPPRTLTLSPTSSPPSPHTPGSTYVFRYEAFILAAECATMDAAMWLVNTARYACGGVGVLLYIYMCV